MANFLKKRLSRKDDNPRPAQRALSMSSVHEWLLCNPIRGVLEGHIARYRPTAAQRH